MWPWPATILIAVIITVVVASLKTGNHIGHTWHGQRSLSPDSSLEGSVACAVVWWAAAVATCFGPDAQSMIVFLVAIFLCQIVFGIYGMVSEAQERKRRGPIHA